MKGFFCDQDGIRSDTNILQVTMPLTYAYIFDNSITIYDNKRVKIEKRKNQLLKAILDISAVVPGFHACEL